MPRSNAPVKDAQTVLADGTIAGRVIDGLNIKRLRPVEDHRGHLTEMFNPEWGVTELPLVYAYQVVMRAGSLRAWVVHYKQEDRLFVSRGTMLWGFYDDRPKSKTRGLLNVFTFSEQNRATFKIPPGVYHGVKNIGEGEAVLINMPSRAYNREDPDKFRLPPKNDLIPWDFSLPPPK